jgi:CubicO group peptidase (beta-lactamase class C family)
MLLFFNFSLKKQNILIISLLVIQYNLLAQIPQSFSQVRNAEEVGVSSERLKRLDDFMQDFVNQGKAPNVLTFVARKGKVVHHKAFGFSNLDKKTPVKKDDIFRIASQTKAIVTVGLLMLYEEGKFLLDEPLAKYIPAFKTPKILTDYNDKDRSKYATRPAKSEITIRQLLSHTAGIPYEHPLQNLPEFKVPFFNSTEKDLLKEVVEKIAARPLVAEPGEKFVYGLNTDVVGRLIEVLSGMPLDVYLTKKILSPLGMRDTYFYLPDNQAYRLVELYEKPTLKDTLKTHQNESYRKFAYTGAKTYFSGGAGLVSTIEDYARFCQMILNKGEFNKQKLLSHSTIDLLFRNQIGDNFVWDRKDKYSLGLQIFTPESTYADNATPGAVMWGGMYCSEYVIDPKEEMILLVFTNVHPYADCGELQHKFRVLVYQSLLK